MTGARKPKSKAFSFYRITLTFAILSLFLFLGSLAYIYAYFLPHSKSKNEKVSSSKTSQQALRISIAEMVSPDDTLIEYARIVRYLSKKINRSVVLIQRDTYKEVNELLKKGQVDLAFICSGAYIDFVRGNQVELLAIPQVSGKTKYQSYIIVRRNSNINRFEDLRGKSFAFEDTLSFASTLYPTYLIKQKGFTRDNYFSNYIFTGSNDRSIQLLKEGVVDGAGVDNLVFNYLATKKPTQLRDIKVIEKSPPYTTPPMVVRADLDPELKNALRQALLTMHKDNRGKKILLAVGIEKFVPAKDDMYDSLRKMKDAVSSK